MALTQISTGMLASGDGTVDLNIDNGTFVVDVSTSRVGIGNSSPSVKLDVTGAMALSGNADFNGNLDVSGTLAVGGVLTANAGVVVDNFTLDGTTLALSSGDLTLDVAGSMIFDADGADYFFKNGGVEVLRISGDATPANVTMRVMPSDGDFIIKGNDGGSTITALTLDMSDAGAATFSSTVSATELTATNGVLNLDDNGSHNGIINAPASLFVNIDSDGTNTGELFAIAKDRTSTSGGTELFRVQEDGSVGVGTSSITNPYSQTNHTDVNIDGTWGGVISFKLGGATKGWVGQRSSGNEDMVIGATAGQELLLYANNVEKLRVTSDQIRIGGGATAYTISQFEISALAGVDRHSRSINSGGNSHIAGSGQRSVMVEGVVAVDTVSAGTILTIPHYSQTGLWRPMMVELMFVTGEYNRTIGSTGGWAKFGYSVLSTVNGLATMGFGGNVSGVSASGINILISFGAGYTNGLANFEGVCMHYKVMGITPDYFQAWNATLN